MKIATFFITFALFSHSSCTRFESKSHLLVRTQDGVTFNNVGLLAYQNGHLCSGTIIKHGVFLTAKHCFRDLPTSGHSLLLYSLNFPRISEHNTNPLFVMGDKIKRIVQEDAASDIAYILYDPTLTDGLITLDQTKLSVQIPVPGTQAQLVGFPGAATYLAPTPRLVSKDCQFTGSSGVIAETPSNPGYDGIVFGTNCEAWYGESGGPVYIVSDGVDSYSTLVGVVTHTFALTADGSVDPAQIHEDSVGPFVADTNVSLLKQATHLSEILATDLNVISNAGTLPKIPIGEICGFASMSALMIEAQNAVTFLQNQKDFKPTFWIDNNSDWAATALTNMVAKNLALRDSRGSASDGYPWAAMIFTLFDRLLESPALRNFKNNGVGQLGITSDLKQCASVECTNYFDFTVLLNADAVINLTARLGEEKTALNLYAIFGHEFGHYILDNYYISSHMYKSYADVHAKIDPLKYHLTVDAIGMLLTSNTRDGFSQVFREAGITNVMGQSRLSGDVATRLQCFSELP